MDKEHYIWWSLTCERNRRRLSGHTIQAFRKCRIVIPSLDEMVDKLLMNRLKTLVSIMLYWKSEKIYHLLSGKRNIILFSLFLVFPQDYPFQLLRSYKKFYSCTILHFCSLAVYLSTSWNKTCEPWPLVVSRSTAEHHRWWQLLI